jgi:hypothetical protein
MHAAHACTQRSPSAIGDGSTSSSNFVTTHADEKTIVLNN